MRKGKLVYFLLLILALRVQAQQDTSFFVLNQFPERGDTLLSGWRYQWGDDTAWARNEWDDSQWPLLESKYLTDWIRNAKDHRGWLRLKLKVGPALRNRVVCIDGWYSVAVELYLNGQKVAGGGVLSADTRSVVVGRPATQLAEPVHVLLSGDSLQTLALRTAFKKGQFYLPEGIRRELATLHIAKADARDIRLPNYFPDLHRNINYLLFGVSLLAFVLHGFFYFFFRKARYNLYYALWSLVSAFLWVDINIIFDTYDLQARMINLVFFDLALCFGQLLLVLMLNNLFQVRKSRLLYIIICLGMIAFGTQFLPEEKTIGFSAIILMPALFNIEAFRVCFKAWKSGKKGALVAMTGIGLGMLGLFAGTACINQGWLNTGMFLILVSSFTVLAILSISIARQLADTNIQLRQKLMEVDQLSREKEGILTRQNELLEKTVEERTAALQQSLENLKATQSQLIQSEKMASLGELTAGIAHEIQNPLNFVNNFSEVNKELIEELKGERLKAEGVRDPQFEDQLLNDIAQNEEKILHHGKRADAIVKGMLQHSRNSGGQKEPADINALCDEYLRLAYHGLRAKDNTFQAKLETDFDPAVGMVSVVPQDIGRVLLNLINNAFYAVDERKKKLAFLPPSPPDKIGTGAGEREVTSSNYEPIVKVSTKRLGPPLGLPAEKAGDGGGIEIRVADNGNGIPQKVLDKIFQPFFTTKPTGQGTGLGLSMSYDIVKAHGGELKVETIPARAGTDGEGEGLPAGEAGSQFIIVLPFN